MAAADTSHDAPLPSSAPLRRPELRPAVFAALALVLFSVWSLSFVAIGFLLGTEQAAARFDALSLTVGRFLPSAAVAALWLLLFRRADAQRLARRRWRRLVLCGLLAVPIYSMALYTGQQHGVPAPIASLTTALAPLFLMLLGHFALREQLGLRQIAGFLVALVGMALVAGARAQDLRFSYPALLALTALAPLCWSLYTVLSKPVANEGSALTWTLLAICAGTLPLLAVAPFTGGPELITLDGPGWGAILFLSLGCTIFGYALWTFLLEHVPASRLGFTIFLNPPLTTTSKWLLAGAFPGTFLFRTEPLELVGGAVVLCGMALALLGRRARPAGDGRSAARP